MSTSPRTQIFRILLGVLLVGAVFALLTIYEKAPSPLPTASPTPTLSPSPLPPSTPPPTATPSTTPSPTPTPSTSPTPTPTPSPTATPTTYTVKPGDTMSSIARAFSMSLPTLIALNPQITNPNIITPGQVVTVSGTPTTTPKPTPTPTPTPTVLPEISRGNTTKNQIIFTFDAGSGAQSAEAILNTLAAHQVHATFALTGKWAEQNPAFTRRIATDGHEIMNHTYSHPYLTQISDASIRTEFQKTEDIIKNLTSKSTKPYFRPPYGARNAHVLEVAGKEGYRSVFWTVDALDWQSTATAESVKKKIYDNLKPGAIVLMHVGDSITGQVLSEVFTEVKSRGYTITSLSAGL